MTFIDFCRAHGLIIDYVIDDGQWHRTKTIDKTNKHNGAYKCLGQVGFVQNHATMTEVMTWKAEGVFDIADYRARMKTAQKDSEQDAKRAAKKAAFMLSKSEVKEFAYCEMKGHKDIKINVLKQPDGTELGLIPMRVNGDLTSLQVLSYDEKNRAWRKTFLKNGITRGAIFTIGNGSAVILCEGFATGLSVFAACQAAKISATIKVCFSAQNMVLVAQKIPPALVIADNDLSLTGKNVAEKIGAPYWISSTVGNDFNDDYLSRGLFAVSNDLKRLFLSKKSIRQIS